jgi:hypothetical protein
VNRQLKVADNLFQDGEPYCAAIRKSVEVLSCLYNVWGELEWLDRSYTLQQKNRPAARILRTPGACSSDSTSSSISDGRLVSDVERISGEPILRPATG